MLEGGALDICIFFLRARGLELRLRLGHINGGSDPALIAALGKIERFLVRHDGRIEKLLLRIEAAQFEIIESEFGVKA